MNKPSFELPPSFYQKEVRNNFSISASMKKVWAVQLELLSVLIDVCKRNNLKVWATDGTLLGTVRDKGYIPWDDDIDMAMLRPDYDKLIAIAKEEFKSPYFFQCGYTDINYPRGHSQLRKDGTAAILSADIHQKFHQGIFIDIFVYDSVPNKPEDVNVLKTQAQDHLKRMKDYCYKPYSIYDFKHNYKLFKLKREIDKEGFQTVYSKYDQLFKENTLDNCNNVACMGFVNDYKLFIRDKHLYDDTIYMPFETIMMPVPVGYDKLLTKGYGDYMKPVKAPSYHGSYLVLDTETSYKDYLPKLRKQQFKDIWKKRFKHLLHAFLK